MKWGEPTGPLRSKLKASARRLAQILLLFPERLFRLADHFRKGGSGWLDLPRSFRSSTISRLTAPFLFWWLELFFLLVDLTGFVEIYETVMDFLKFPSRPLTPAEEKMARSIFGETLDLQRMRIDETARLGPPQLEICYVSGYHINSWGPMSDAVFIHELVHVWQYRRLGLRYIPLALRAQFSESGYDYGGVAALEKALRSGKRLEDFNLEQQADIIADLFRLRNGGSPRWSNGEIAPLALYEHFAGQLLEPGRSRQRPDENRPN